MDTIRGFCSALLGSRMPGSSERVVKPRKKFIVSRTRNSLLNMTMTTMSRSLGIVFLTLDTYAYRNVFFSFCYVSCVTAPSVTCAILPPTSGKCRVHYFPAHSLTIHSNPKSILPRGLETRYICGMSNSIVGNKVAV